MERAKNSIHLCSNNKVWESSSSCEDDDDGDFFYVDDDGMMMTSWPPRTYTCSFCKREFRSAQALGGHMNVHRRDRAQLRQLSQISPNSSPNLTPNTHLNLNLPPNPNHNYITLSPPTLPPPPSDLISRKQFECFRRKNNLMAANYNNSAQGFEGFGLKQQEVNHGNLKRASGLIRLDLEMKDISVGDSHGVIKQDLDLELRLGYN